MALQRVEEEVLEDEAVPRAKGGAQQIDVKS